jgi:putative transposase
MGKRMHKNRKSPRWKEWDYSTPGIYFITICTKNRETYFGEVRQGKMILSQIGIIADLLWYEIKNHHKNVELDEYVIMPDHIHGIIILNRTDGNRNTVDSRRVGACPDPTGIVRPSISLSNIVGGYKSAVSKHVHRLGFDFKWQTSFHDHIVRNEFSLNRIQNYIIQNPMKWWYRKNGLSSKIESIRHTYTIYERKSA